MTIMAQPTQDMDISSSFLSSDNLLSNNSSIQIYEKEIIMDGRNKVDLAWMRNGPIVSKGYENQELSDNRTIDVKSCESIFPWLSKFNKLMCSSVGHRSYQLLKRLLSLYRQNILTSINTYCEMKLDAVKLKDHLSSTLPFFHLYWNDIKEHVNDSNSYLNEMSVLLGIYIDMELKTFKHSMDSSKIASKLLSALWIYLCNSERHIFRVLLKLKPVAKKYSQIYDFVLTRSFNSLKKNMEPLIDTDYVRYLLVLKLWKKIKESVEDKKEVNKMALTILGPRIPKMRDELSKIISKPPTGHESETVWLLQSNVFDLNSACYNFIVLEEAISKEFKDPHSTMNSNLNFQSPQHSLHVQGSFANYELQKDETRNPKNNLHLENEIKCNKPTEKTFPVKKRNRFKKYKTVSKLKPGEVILIDLTEEDELKRDKKEKRRKGARKLEWLKGMKKKYKVQKHTGEIKCRNQVEIVDAHSTANPENFAERALLERLPISDNKVSESTESCTSLEQKAVQNNIHYNSQSTHEHGCNKRSNDLKYVLQYEQCDICASSLVQTDTQRNRVLYLLKLLSAVGQNTKEPKAMLNQHRENEDENVTSCRHFCRNTNDESNEIINTQSKEESFSQLKSTIETIFLSKQCQSSTTDMQTIKQELPTNADCNMPDADSYCQTESVCVQNDYHLCDFKSANTHSPQATESVKQKVSRDSHECTGCCKKIEAVPFSYHNNTTFNTIKTDDVVQNATDNTTTDKKSICDKNVMCMLSDLDKCMDVLNRIGEHIMTVHAEKQRLECLDKTDVCDVSTTVSGSQPVESSSDWIENINSLTNSEKLSRIIELYDKKDVLNASCDCKDSHRWDSQETNTLLNQVKCEAGNYQKGTVVSTSQPKEYRSCEKGSTTFSEGKSSSSFAYNHIKSEFDQPIKKEDTESFEVLRDESQNASQNKNTTLTNSRALDSASLLYDLKDTKEFNRDTQHSSQKNNRMKTRSAEEFENIDILDSILNGDITLEDEQEIWEDTQSPLISPLTYDNSHNVLNCITELFSQSEHKFTNETEEKYIVSDTENPQTPLPEGSLATTGLLNSLFDFDLTNMDSPSTDFIYSNIQTVNPRLIKKNFTDECFSTKSYNSSGLHSEQKVLAAETNDLETMLVQKEGQLCSKQNIDIDSSVNVVGFGLNSSTEEVLEFPSLHKSVSSFSDQSTVLADSDNISEAKEPFPKCSISSLTDKFDTDSIIEKPYIFQKRDMVNQVQAFNDTTSRGLSEICTIADIPPDTSMNCTLNQQNDVLPSHNKYTCVELETSPLVIKQSLDSYDLPSSTDSPSYNIDTLLQCIEQKHENAFERRNIQKNVQHNCKEKQSHVTKQRVKMNAECRSSKRSLRCKKNTKMKGTDETESPLPPIAQPNQNELSLRCSQITVINPLNYEDVQNPIESPLSTFHMSYHQKSPQTTVRIPKNIQKQLKRVGIQQLRNISQRKQQILLNFHEDSMLDKIFNEDSRVQENSQYTMEDDIISEDSNTSCLSESLNAADNKSCVKFPKRNVKINADDTKVKLVSDKDINEVSNNILVKSGAKWSLQNIGTPPSKFIEEQVISTLDEDTPLKRRKLTSKFSSNLKRSTVVCTVNQQKMQKKHFASTKKGNTSFIFFAIYFAVNIDLFLVNCLFRYRYGFIVSLF